MLDIKGERKTSSSEKSTQATPGYKCSLVCPDTFAVSLEETNGFRGIPRILEALTAPGWVGVATPRRENRISHKVDRNSKCLGESLLDECCLDSKSIAILCSFGYSEVEARFLILAITHSGHFTRQQFLKFTGKRKGWMVHSFTRRLLAKGHAKITPLLHKTFLFHLCSRQMYDDLERPDLRIRSTCSDEFILARLLSLDFVIAHPGLNYLETSAGKIAFFTEETGFPMQILPGKIYAGIPTLERKKRYFTDRCPIYLDSENLSRGALPRPVFVYCDPYPKSLDAFKTHLKRYEDLLYRLPDFRFIYASPYPKKLDRAKAMFDRVMRLQERLDLADLVRYFRVRWLWDEWKHAELTREDRDRVRAGDKRFCGEPFASAYRKWCQEPMGEAELRTFIGPAALTRNYRFETYLLPEQHSIFRYETSRPVRTKNGTIAKTEWSADGSAFSSTAEEWDYL